MKIRPALICCLLFLLLLHTTGLAQSPQLTTPGNKKEVYLQSLKTSITVTGNIAVTTMEMIFFNSSNRILEGELVFPLPEGSAVTRYAIDINGVLREAVPVEKQKGTQVFEAIEHRRVDPGLLEKTTGNNFRTRIYPLPAHGRRTVLIAYNEELLMNNDHSLRYRLLLDYKQPIDHFTLDVRVVQSSFKPQFDETPDDNMEFEEWNNNYTARLDKTNYTPGHSVSFNIPKNNENAETVLQEAGGNYYFLMNTWLKKESRPKPIPGELAVIWDVSLSGLSRNIKKELELLAGYIDKKKNLTVHLAVLNNEYKNTGSFEIRNGDWQALKQTIEQFTYDGATNYSLINLRATPGAEYLLFSDGLSTLGGNDFPLVSKPVYTITSSAKADYTLLQSIAQKTGASFINLNKLDRPGALELLTVQPLQLLCIRQNDAISELYPLLPQPVSNGCSLAGVSSTGNTVITLQYGYGNTIMFEKTVPLQFNQHQAAAVNIQKIWAQKKIAALETDYENNAAVISQLGKQFSIATRNTSLIVLENVMDYVQYEIEPPAELRKEYDRIIKQRLAVRQTQQVQAMKNAFGYAEDLVQWWNNPVPVVKYYKTVTASDSTAMPADNAQQQEVVVTAGLAALQDREAATESDKAVSGYMLQGRVAGVVVSANANRQRSSYTVATLKKEFETTKDEVENVHIEIKQWTPERSYLKTMAKASKEKQYATYLQLRTDYMATPSFYFDMACYFIKQKDSANGALILSNLAELDLENHELYKMLGYKLKETGRYNEEVFVYRKVLQWRPQEPQSYRDYGLALADAGFYQQALDTLYTAINKQYESNIMSNYEGIEEVIVTEINQLVTMHGNKLNTSRINKKLLHAMPVDTRVVLNWNMNDTDIDLWVTDPHGEKCYYSHKTTAAGARISDDFTEGYGPEQFMLKKAIKGRYTIEADFYGERQLKLAGPATVMAEVFTHYADGRQERKIITIQLEKTGNQTLLIGSFSFDK